MNAFLKRHFLLADLALATMLMAVMAVVLLIYAAPVNENAVRFVMSGAMIINSAIIFLMHRAVSRAQEKAEKLPYFELLRESETFGLVPRTFYEMRLACMLLTLILVISFIWTFINADHALAFALIAGLSGVLARVARSLWIIARINEIERVATKRVTGEKQD